MSVNGLMFKARLTPAQEIKPTLIEPLRAKQTLKLAELQDGDIVCFQKTSELSTEASAQVDTPPSETTKVADRSSDAREYYDFLEHRRTVKFHPHPTKTDQAEHPPFELVLNSKILYDALADKVSAHLGIPSTHIRFWTVNAATNNPKAPVRRNTNPSLRNVLNPTGGSTFNASQRSDALYFEVLEMSLDEFDTKKNIKIVWLSEGITKEVSLAYSSFSSLHD